MKPSSLKIFLLALTIWTLLSEVSGAVSLEPPPAVVTNTLATLTPPVGTAFMRSSDRIEALGAAYDTSNPLNPQTTFTMYFFNRSATNNVNTYTHTVTGLWSIVKCT